MATSTSTIVPTVYAGIAAAESGQDSSNVIIIVTPKKDYRIARNCSEDVEQHLPLSVEETSKFASAELVAPKPYLPYDAACRVLLVT